MRKINQLDRRIRDAVRHFWKTRDLQKKSQGKGSGNKDRGSRSAVTGGAQMDGFVSLIRDILVDDGVPDVSVFGRRRVDLPGYYRAEKKWDLLIVSKDQLLATIEFKSQVGPSFGNNFNNRSEEAIGSAADFRTAYRDGAFKLSQDP